jgi:hypothetical protein
MFLPVRVQVLDAICRGGSADKPNDDAYGVARHAAFVIDGATSLVETPLMPGESDAQWVAIEAAEILAGLAEARALCVEELVEATVAQLIERFEARRSRPPREVFEYPFASMMLMTPSAAGVETGWFGDCRLLAVDATDALADAGPGPAGRGREQQGARDLAKSSGTDATATLREHAMPSLRRHRNSANSGTGRGVLGPDPRCMALLGRKSLSLSLPAHVLMMSDGFYTLVTDYGRYDDRGLIGAAREKGLTELYAELRTIEENDPQGIRFPRYKTHDDATALLIEISVGKSNH